MLKITLPIYWTDVKKTKPSTTHLVGENFFRNAHYHVKNKLKKDYHELVANQLKGQPIETLSQFTVKYTLYYKNPSSDPSNIVSKIEKFTLDALQELGVLKEDNVLHHLGSSFVIGGCDKQSPRVEVEIFPVEVKE